MPSRKRKPKRDIDTFIAEVEKECGLTLIQIAARRVLDPKTSAQTVIRLMEYIYGKPKEQVTYTGSITVYDAVAKARARVLQFEQARQSKEPPQIDAVLPARTS